MSDRKYLVVFLSLGLSVVLVAVLGFVFGSPEADRPVIPEVLEEISPLPGSQVPLQTAIEVDVPVGYRLDIYVDGFRLPESEVRFVEGTGVYSWAPTRSTTLTWEPGPHTVTVRWRRIGGLPDVGEHSWDFRVF